MNTFVEGRAATVEVAGRRAVFVEVVLRDAHDEVSGTALREQLAALGLDCGVSPNLAWVEGSHGDDGVWRGVARFHPLGWRPGDGTGAPPTGPSPHRRRGAR